MALLYIIRSSRVSVIQTNNLLLQHRYKKVSVQHMISYRNKEVRTFLFIFGATDRTLLATDKQVSTA